MSGRAHELLVKLVGHESLEVCHQLRRVVFVEGQGVPESLEIDGLDDQCLHFLATLGGRAIGCARLRPIDGAVKAERVAVLEQHRGSGVGRALMEALEARAAQDGFSDLLLHAQADVVAFYERIGYRGEGERFEEASISHWAMRKSLSRAPA